MAIKVTYEGRPYSAAQMARLRKIAIASLLGGGGRSASGVTAALACDYCIEHGLPFRLLAWPGVGYTVELIEGA